MAQGIPSSYSYPSQSHALYLTQTHYISPRLPCYSVPVILPLVTPGHPARLGSSAPSMKYQSRGAYSFSLQRTSVHAIIITWLLYLLQIVGSLREATLTLLIHLHVLQEGQEQELNVQRMAAEIGG